MEKKKIVWPTSFVAPFKGCKTILALGASRGSRLNKLCNAIGARGVGIELCEEMVNRKRACDVTELICGDALALIKKYDTNSFDGVTMFDLLHCLTKRQAKNLVREAKRVAKKVVVTSLPVDHIKPRSAVGTNGKPYAEGKAIAQKSLWTLAEAQALWDKGVVNFYYDKEYIERAHSKRGKEYIDWLRKEQYHGKFAVMTLAVWRKGV